MINDSTVEFMRGKKMQRFVTEFGHLLGKVPDAELARRAGYIHASVIGEIRQRLGVEVTRRGKSLVILTDPELLTATTKKLCERYSVHEDTVYKARKIAKEALKTASLDRTEEEVLIDGGVALNLDTFQDVSLQKVSLWDRILGFFRKAFRNGSPA